MRFPSRFAAFAFAALFASSGASARELVNQRLEVRPGVNLPIEASEDLGAPRSEAKLAVIVLHGLTRNVMGYYGYAREAAAAAGVPALVIAPQFLTIGDARELHAPTTDLRFAGDSWTGGALALGPAPASGFEALDALLTKLADRSRFPNLERVVVVGHSAGGQVAQRFAILTKADGALAAAHIALRFVVANAGTYAYFGAERPLPKIAAACAGYNDWKFGFATPPPYHAEASVADLEHAYVARDVVYLIGGDDTDPNHPQLDRSCKAEAEGATRWERGHGFLSILRARDQGAPNHRLYVAPGVGHDARGMLLSACGLAAVFDKPGCTAEGEWGPGSAELTFFFSVRIIHTMKSAELIRELTGAGWKLDRVRDSHHVFRREERPGHVTVPHPKKDLGKGLVQAIRKQAGLEK